MLYYNPHFRFSLYLNLQLLLILLADSALLFLLYIYIVYITYMLALLYLLFSSKVIVSFLADPFFLL